MLVLSLPLCCSVNLPTRSLWIMKNDFEMQLWCSPSDAGDYEGISERVAGRLVGGWGGELTVYITSLLFLMAQHRTILKIIPKI